MLVTRIVYNAGDPDSAAISFVCLDYTTDHTGDPDWAQRNSFFNHNCPNGMRAQVNFPPCWDGVNVDSDDHQSHMAWPSGGVSGGDCPASHPKHLVTLFYEFIFQVQNFPFNNGSQPTWVWSNGDATGYGLHADFINGWPSLINGTNVLQQAINQCNANNGVGGMLGNCPPFVPYLNLTLPMPVDRRTPRSPKISGMGMESSFCLAITRSGSAMSPSRSPPIIPSPPRSSTSHRSFRLVTRQSVASPKGLPVEPSLAHRSPTII